MKLKIDGDINQSYVQNLCLMFFPCEKFSESEEETDETPKAYVKLDRLEKGYRAKVILTFSKSRRKAPFLWQTIRSTKIGILRKWPWEALFTKPEAG